jgi:hypothetical protein
MLPRPRRRTACLATYTDRRGGRQGAPPDKHRSSIYRSLSPVIGKEETEALLAQFPARDAEEPATKDFVRTEAAQVRAEVAALEARMNERFRQQTMWTAGAITVSMTAGMGLAASIATLLG